MTAELSRTIAAELVKSRKQAYGSVCSYFRILENGHIDSFYQAPCVGNLRHTNDGKVVGIGHWMNNKKNGAFRPMFTEWLVNESPWKSVWAAQDQNIYTTPEWRDKYGLIVDNVDIPSNLLVGALIALRISTEGVTADYAPNYAEVWARLASEGVHPALALVIAGNLSVVYDGKNKRTDAYTIGLWYATHWPLNVACMLMPSVKNFMDGKPVNLNESFSVNQNYTGVDKVWGDVEINDRFGRDTMTAKLLRLGGVKELHYGVQTGPLSFEEVLGIAREIESSLK